MKNNFREDLNKWWELKDAQAIAEKASQGVLIDLMKMYSDLDPEDKSTANNVFMTWLSSDNERKQFDSLAMIEHFKIRTALNPLKIFRDRIMQRKDPGAPFDLKKVDRILSKLEG